MAKIRGDELDNRLEGGARADKIYGFGGWDLLIGAAGDDLLVGGAGDDVIEAGVGIDTVDAGDGDDEVTLANLGRDRIDLGAGNDVLALDPSDYEYDARQVGGLYEGGDGYDLLDFEDLLPFRVPVSGVAFDGTSLTVDGRVVATVSGFEAVYIEGSRLQGLSGDDTLSGSDAADRLVGLGGDDRIYGGAGRNVIIAGAGDDDVSFTLDASRDLLKGGAGTDELDFDGDEQAVVMTGDLSSGVVITVGGVEAAYATGFEKLEMRGSSESDQIIGGSGDDYIGVGAGRDVVRTFGGDDRIFVDLDNRADRIDLGAGTDVATIRSSSDAAVTMTRDERAVTVTLGDRTSAVIAGAENFVITTGAGDDRLIGGDATDALSAGGGRNNLSGGGGDDVIAIALDGEMDRADGGSGHDRLIVAMERDFGEDFEAPLVTEVLADGRFRLTVGGDVVLEARSIEAIYLDDTYAGDLLIGQAGDDVLRSTFSVDTLIGGEGDDTLFAGRDGGRFAGGDGDDTISFEGTYGGVTVTLVRDETATAIRAPKTPYELSGFENVTGSDYADTIVGDAGDNVINGGGDRFGEGDVLDGGEGVDTISFAERSSGVYVNLLSGVAGYSQQSGPSSYTTVVRNFENVAGGERNDWIVGDDGDNRIAGMGGGDTLQGGLGADTFVFAKPASFFESAFGFVDKITDFSSSEGDRIDLTGYSAELAAEDGKLAFIGAAAFSGRAGELRFEAHTLITWIALDLDGDLHADKTIVLSGVQELIAGDFILA